MGLHFVTFTAIVLNREGILSFVVTGAARFSRLHLGHGRLQGTGFVGENLCVAIGAFV